jgi:pimeloyl-ACP methyl ester carboxylesterase
VDLQVEGLGAHLLAAGEGAPVLVLASNLVRAVTYRRTLRALAARHRVVVAELPGSGRSGRIARPWRDVELARWTRALIEEVGLGAPVVVGHSSSGPPALALAAEHPEVVRGIVLVGAVGAHPTGRLLSIALARAWDGLLEPRLTLSAWHHLAYNAIVHPRNLLHQVLTAGRCDQQQVAERVEVPVLLAWGAHDHTMPLASLERFARWMPHARRLVHPRGSHDWLIEHPEDFAAALEDFSRLSPARAPPATRAR